MKWMGAGGGGRDGTADQIRIDSVGAVNYSATTFATQRDGYIRYILAERLLKLCTVGADLRTNLCISTPPPFLHIPIIPITRFPSTRHPAPLRIFPRVLPRRRCHDTTPDWRASPSQA